MLDTIRDIVYSTEDVEKLDKLARKSDDYNSIVYEAASAGNPYCQYIIADKYRRSLNKYIEHKESDKLLAMFEYYRSAAHYQIGNATDTLYDLMEVNNLYFLTVYRKYLQDNRIDHRAIDERIIMVMIEDDNR